MGEPARSNHVSVQEEKTHQARVVALSLAQCTAMVNLLRAHHQNDHAENIEAAMSVIVNLVSDTLGKDTLSQAMDWVCEEIDDGAELPDLAFVTH
jgi:hypothetical protein